MTNDHQKVTLAIIKKDKELIEKCIKTMLQHFHEKTGLRIEGVDLEVHDIHTIGAGRKQRLERVNINIKF